MGQIKPFKLSWHQDNVFHNLCIEQLTSVNLGFKSHLNPKLEELIDPSQSIKTGKIVLESRTVHALAQRQ